MTCAPSVKARGPEAGVHQSDSGRGCESSSVLWLHYVYCTCCNVARGRLVECAHQPFNCKKCHRSPKSKDHQVATTTNNNNDNNDNNNDNAIPLLHTCIIRTTSTSTSTSNLHHLHSATSPSHHFSTSFLSCVSAFVCITVWSPGTCAVSSVFLAPTQAAFKSSWVVPAFSATLSPPVSSATQQQPALTPGLMYL